MGEDFPRTKGIINEADFDGPLVIQGAQHIFHSTVTLDE
tara:strand:+ start:345 stop:461 length:117 start_codon:yes stop_codon:yes gene_type:complete